MRFCVHRSGVCSVQRMRLLQEQCFVWALYIVRQTTHLCSVPVNLGFRRCNVWILQGMFPIQYTCCVDLGKAYDHVSWGILWEVRYSIGRQGHCSPCRTVMRAVSVFLAGSQAHSQRELGLARVVPCHRFPRFTESQSATREGRVSSMAPWLLMYQTWVAVPPDKVWPGTFVVLYVFPHLSFSSFPVLSLADDVVLLALSGCDLRCALWQLAIKGKVFSPHSAQARLCAHWLWSLQTCTHSHTHAHTQAAIHGPATY